MIVTIPATDPQTDEPTAFYVSAIDGRQTALASGPYETHDEAVADVDRVREIFEAADPRAAFCAWGTAGFRGPRDEAPNGVLQAIEARAAEVIARRGEA